MPTTLDMATGLTTCGTWLLSAMDELAHDVHLRTDWACDSDVVALQSSPGRQDRLLSAAQVASLLIMTQVSEAPGTFIEHVLARPLEL